MAGYFTDPSKAAEMAAALDGRKPAGVYLVLNEINPALLARSPNKLTDILNRPPATVTLSDADGFPSILTRPGRPAFPLRKMSIARRKTRREIARRGCLRKGGPRRFWPIAATVPTSCIVSTCLTMRRARPLCAMRLQRLRQASPAAALTLTARYSMRRGYGSCTAQRPARGTICPTGPTGRPHWSRFPIWSRWCPSKLRAVAGLVKKPEPSKTSTGGNGQFNHRLDVPRWLTDRGIVFHAKERPDSLGRTVYILDTCPFDNGHGGGDEVSVMQDPDGKLAAACMHNSCTGRGWQQFKQAIGPPDPDHYDPPLSDHQGNGQAERVLCTPEQPQEEKPREPPAFTRLLTGGELLALDLKPRFLVRGVLVEGQPMVVGGRSKTLKTSVVCDLAISLGSGTPFLGKFDAHRVNVGFWSGESGAAVVRETAKRQAAAKGIDLAACSVLWSFDLPKLCHLDHLKHFAQTIDKHKLQVAIVDPLYLSLLNADTAGQASNLFAMGAALQPLSKLAQEAGVTLIVLHHFRKGGQPNEDEPAGLEELTMSGAAEWARQWLLLQRRAAYQGDGRHLLWMRCGGSAGHSSLWGVTIDEGQLDPDTFTGRTWDVTVAPVADARAEAKHDAEARKAAEQERREGEHRERLLTVLRATPDGDTERALSRMAHLNPDAFGRAIVALMQEGRAARCEVAKGGRKYDGFKPTGR